MNQSSITLTLPMPPSANRYWRHAKGITYVSAEAKQYRKTVKVLGCGCTPIVGRVRLTAHVYRPRKAGDLMNREKILTDCLEGVAYQNDKQIWEAHFFLADDKHNPRVVVVVESIDRARLLPL